MEIDFLSDLIITKVYSVNTIFTKENAETRRINRPMWAIVLKYEGETIYKTSAVTISNAENMVILPKGSSYNWTCTKAGHYCIIEFECEGSYPDIFSFKITNSDAILKIFKELEYKMLSKAPFYQLDCITGTYTILLKLLKSLLPNYLPPSKTVRIKPALDYMTQNYDKSMSNDELAKIADMSTIYFRKIFTETMGIAPIQYLHKLRIEKAKNMLKSDYGKISDIALTVGYANVYHFSKMFKSHTGVSPSEYLRQSKRTSCL